MTEHYVTLFDSNFIPQGLALHHSLLSHGGDFVLWILCLDDTCYSTLRSLNLDCVELLQLESLETEPLLRVKPDRSAAEYCWTLTPWSIQWVFELNPTIHRVTYLDADVYLLKSPKPIFDELDEKQKSVLITEHGYAPEFDQTPTSGRFCVQFVTFSRNRGWASLTWWRDRCIEWCFARVEDGKFGDQKYIETMALLFASDVHIATHNEWFQAPWNACIFPFSSAIIYHFHQLRIAPNGMVKWSYRYNIPGPTEQYIYNPYCDLLISLAYRALGRLPKQHPVLTRPIEVTGLRRIARNIKNLINQILEQSPQFPPPRNTIMLDCQFSKESYGEAR